MPPKRMTANPVRAPRYRPGKPIAPEEPSDDEASGSEESGSESEPEAASPPPRPKPVYVKKTAAGTSGAVGTAGVAKQLKDVDLSKRFAEGAKEEVERKAKEEEEKKAKEAEDDEYTTEESEEEEEEEESEEEEEEEKEAPAPKKFLRPTFIPKSQRGNAEAKKAAEEAAKLAQEEAEKKEAEELLEAHLKRDAEAKVAGRRGWDDDVDDEEGIDDTDSLDPAAERAAWKLRELLRIKRERQALAQLEEERAEVERRREMDPTLREKEDMEYVRKQKEEKMESRGKMGFMQKFYHKGAFYQDADILKRDYATASVEDAVKNKEVLPKYMQVRGDEVGKRGRTRYTHLAAEDTTMQDGGSMWDQKKKRGGFQVPAGVDDRFRPDPRPEREEGGRREDRSDDRHPDRRGDRDRRDGRDRREDRDKRDDMDGRRGGSRWDEKPRDYDQGPRDGCDRRRWDDDGGRRDRGRDDRGHRGNSYASGRDRDRGDDRERKRPHSPRQGEDAEKRQRRDASPAR
ncbi:splicing factor, Prp19-binding domain-containing protein [Pyronema domesticum]|uniref:Similar to Uncharacterized protein C1782.03 acc. no. Q9P7H6 n=1 Tax=Pyronema omphalodes (strain CBS 100304) TaxID=1076935 RepID=U4LRM8_PYROM|nr:splicing factor, Prp19-binding domain-containing protein [Pyronema domesticum]CCX29946.1 Similar to Uncharacterized protein C1782.03; acc. no. Q9P7H6 [Pyronema omphalodes CBS 100304]